MTTAVWFDLDGTLLHLDPAADVATVPSLETLATLVG